MLPTHGAEFRVSAAAILWVTSLPVALVLLFSLAGRSVQPPWARIVAALAIAIPGLVADGWRLASQLELHDWRAVEAIVVRSERGTRRNDWRFEYEYEIEGQRHRGSTLTTAPHTRSREDTDQLAAHFGEGKRITVHVNPDDARRSVVYAEPSYRLPIAGFAIHGALLAAALWRVVGGKTAAGHDPR